MTVEHIIPTYVKLNNDIICKKPRIRINYTKNDSNVTSIKVYFENYLDTTKYVWDSGDYDVSGQSVGSSQTYDLTLTPYVDSAESYPESYVKTVQITGYSTVSPGSSKTVNVDGTSVDKYLVVYGYAGGGLAAGVGISYGSESYTYYNYSVDLDTDSKTEVLVVLRVSGESVTFTVSSENSNTTVEYFVVDGSVLSDKGLIAVINVYVVENPTGYTHTLSRRILDPVNFVVGQPGTVEFVTAYGVA